MQSVKISNKAESSNWSSFSDTGTIVSLDDYLAVEREYIRLVLCAAEALSIQEFQINSLEDFASCSVYKDKSLVSICNLEPIIRDVLRERYWCKLISSCLQVHFGYDYCMYIVSFSNSLNLDKIAYDQNIINLIKHPSPYMQ